MKIEYFACLKAGAFPGVENKLKQTISSLCDSGHSASLSLIDGGTFSKYRRLSAGLFKSNADVVVVRNLIGLICCFPALVALRLKGRRVVIDVPTPIVATIQELRKEPNSFANELKKAFYRISFPFAFFPANRVLQYADESSWFRFGLFGKTKMVANGIGVQDIKIKLPSPFDFQKDFALIAVASLADWHGFDRVIRGLATYYSDLVSGPRVTLVIIGDGGIREKWQDLVNELKLSDVVSFVGLKRGDALDEHFRLAHVAISSLGLYRLNLEMASVLKAREYAARGIPFVAAGRDIDFEPAPRFMKMVENNNSEIKIAEVFNWYKALAPLERSHEEIRGYAMKKLDFSVKVNEIFVDL